MDLEGKKEIRSAGLYSFIYMLATIIGGYAIGSTAIPVNFGVGLLAAAACIFIVICGKKTLPVNEIFRTDSRMNLRRFLIALGAFSLIKIIGMLITFGLVYITGLGNVDASLTDSAGESVIETAASIFSLSIVAPVCEEIVFRGAVAKRFMNHGTVFAMIASSLFFAVFHGNAFQLVTTFLAGLILFYIAERYGIVYSMLFHFINNFLLGDVLNALTKNSSFLSDYGIFIVSGLLVLLGGAAAIGTDTVSRVAEFLTRKNNEKGAYRTALGSVWFVLMCIIVVLQSAMVYFGMLLAQSLPL